MAKPKMGRPSVFTIVSMLALASTIAWGNKDQWLSQINTLRENSKATQQSDITVPSTLTLADALTLSVANDGEARTYTDILILNEENSFYPSKNTILIGSSVATSNAVQSVKHIFICTNDTRLSEGDIVSATGELKTRHDSLFGVYTVLETSSITLTAVGTRSDISEQKYLNPTKEYLTLVRIKIDKEVCTQKQ